MYLIKRCDDKGMKKIIIMSLFLFIGMSMYAFEKQNSSLSNIGKSRNTISQDELLPIHPTYLTDITEQSGWGSNLFLEVKGGASAFLGSPIGCGDVFDRTKPVLQVGLGKWFTPSVGGRVSYQGLQFKNANMVSMNYQYYHADFMYNLTHGLQQDDFGLSKLDLIPFVGLGIVKNTSTIPGYIQTDGNSSGNHPFAFGYGFEIRYHLYDRLHLVGEISGMTTLKNFDCVGSSCTFGDNMLSLSVGLSYTIGRKGWKKVIDAVPYIRQNEYLHSLYSKASNDSQVETDHQGRTNKNDYDGLNSLRTRLSMNSANDKTENDSIMIGTPVYFYFKLNSAKLVDKSEHQHNPVSSIDVC